MGTSSSASSCWSALERLGWETWQRSAALPKCPSFSNAIKYSNCLKNIVVSPIKRSVNGFAGLTNSDRQKPSNRSSDRFITIPYQNYNLIKINEIA